MYRIDDLAGILGLSYQATRNRVKLLEQYFNREVKGGNGAVYAITNNGLEILKQVQDKYKFGNSLKQSFEIVKRETNESKEQDNNRDELVHELKQRIKFLEKQIELKDNQIQQLLPKTKQSLFERIKRYFIS